MYSRLTHRTLGAIGALSAIALVTGCAPEGVTAGGGSVPASGEVIEYRVATIDGLGTPMNDGFDRFIEEVETCSDGRLVGTNYPAGQLGGFVDLIDGNRQGTYEITSGGFDVEGATAPIISALSLGYVFEDEQHVERAIDEMQGEMAKQLDKATGVTILGMGEDGWRWTFASKEVTSLADLAGLKIRVPEAEIPLGLWKALGASATPVPFTEIYNGLETGVIDAGESALAQIDSNAFWEPAPYLVNTKHWFNIKPVRANSQWFNGLDKELQECLTSVGESVFADVRAESRERESATLEKLTEEGVTVLDEPTDLDEWKARSDSYNAEYFAKYPGSEEFIEQIKALAE
jgi:TRAP-type C4-dicarboxylate transport system substrate-binding protein